MRPRFYVIATCGYGAGASGRWCCSYAVLDRAFCHREVFTAYAGQDRAGGRTDTYRRELCEQAAAECNQRHEQRMLALSRGDPARVVSDVGRWEHPALTEALKALKGRRGKPSEADRPPPSLFPMTPAGLAAVEMDKRQRGSGRP